MFFPHVYSLGQGQTNPWGQNFNVNRKALSVWSFVASFEKIPLNSDFIHIFNVFFFHVYIAPGQGQTMPWGQNFDPSRKAYNFDLVLQIQNKSLSTLILYIPLNYFIHVYGPGARADKPLGSKCWCQQKGLIILTIRCKFKKTSHWCVILYIFLMFSCMYPRPGIDNLLVSKF